MQYTQIYTDRDGESHFEEVVVDLVANDFAPPVPPFNVSTPIPAAQLLFTMLPSGWYSDWHPAPRRQYWTQIAGQLNVEISDEEVRRFDSGDVVLLEDVAEKGHVTQVVGQYEPRGMFVQLPG